MAEHASGVLDLYRDFYRKRNARLPARPGCYLLTRQQWRAHLRALQNRLALCSGNVETFAAHHAFSRPALLIYALAYRTDGIYGRLQSQIVRRESSSRHHDDGSDYLVKLG